MVNSKIKISKHFWCKIVSFEGKIWRNIQHFHLVYIVRPDFFLLVDLRDFFFKSRVKGTKKK